MVRMGSPVRFRRGAPHRGFDGAFGDVQPGGDGPVGHALGDQPEDLSFSFADLGKRAVDDHLEGTGKRLVLVLPVSRWTTR